MSSVAIAGAISGFPVSGGASGFRAQVASSAPANWYKLDADYTDSGSDPLDAESWHVDAEPTLGQPGLHTEGTSLQNAALEGLKIGDASANRLSDKYLGADAATIEAVVGFSGEGGGSSGVVFSCNYEVESRPFFRLHREHAGDTLRVVANADNTTQLDLAGPVVSTGTPHHVVAIIDPSNDRLALYVDGVLAAEDTSAGFIGSTIGSGISGNSNSTSGIGCVFNGGYSAISAARDSMVGFIHEVAVYKRALTATEITDHYNALVFN